MNYGSAKYLCKKSALSSVVDKEKSSRNRLVGMCKYSSKYVS